MRDLLLSRPSYEDIRYDKQIYEYIRKIREGDIKLRNQVIGDYLSFIAQSVSKVSGKYEDIQSSDKFSIGMIAFNEAINNYDERKGGNFFYYCDLLIRNRVIDYYRKNERNHKVYPFTYFESENEFSFEEKYLKSDSFYQYENVEIQEGIEFLEKKLSEFNISLEDVIKKIPKHRDSINMCIRIAKSLCDSDYLYSKLLKKKSVPLKELLQRVEVHKRTIERNRKFIITVSLMIRTDYICVDEYLENNLKNNNTYNDIYKC